MKRMWAPEELNAKTVTDVNNAYQNDELILKDSYDGQVILSSSLTVVASYVKAFLNNSELQLIFNCRIKNETEESVSINADSRICSFTLPDKLLAKVYSHDGKALSEATGNVAIAYTTLFVSQPNGAPISGLTGTRFASLYYVKDQNKIYMYNEGGAIAIPSNTTYDFDARISLAID